MDWRSAWAKTKAAVHRPPVKYGLIGLAIGLWGLGLADQLASSEAAMKYLLMSLLIVAVAAI